MMVISVHEPRVNQNCPLKLYRVVNIALDDLPHQVFVHEKSNGTVLILCQILAADCQNKH